VNASKALGQNACYAQNAGIAPQDSQVVVFSEEELNDIINKAPLRAPVVRSVINLLELAGISSIPLFNTVLPLLIRQVIF
jgi:hypothetical protein